METNIIFFSVGIGLGVLIMYFTRPNPYDLVSKVYAKYVEDMKHFATAYSELSVQFVNQHLPTATPASFTRHMTPSSSRSEDDGWNGAQQPEDDEADMMGGNLTL